MKTYTWLCLGVLSTIPLGSACGGIEVMAGPEGNGSAVLWARLSQRDFSLVQTRNTSLIEIRVDSDNASSAAAIANEVAEAYRRFLRESQQNPNQYLKVLKTELEVQNQKIVSVQARLAERPQVLGIVGVYPDDRLTSLMKEQDSTQQRLAGLTNLFAANHPEVRALRDKLAVIDSHVEMRRSYDLLKRELESLYYVRDRLEVKISQLTVESKLPRSEVGGVLSSSVPVDPESGSRLATGGLSALETDDAGSTVLNEPPPRLNISELTPAQTRLSWSTNSTGYTLEFTDNLTSASWSPAVEPMELQEDQFSVIVERTAGNRFFRLRKR